MVLIIKSLIILLTIQILKIFLYTVARIANKDMNNACKIAKHALKHLMKVFLCIKLKISVDV